MKKCNKYTTVDIIIMIRSYCISMSHWWGTPSEHKWGQLHCFSQKESAVCVHVFIHGKQALQYSGQHSKCPCHLHAQTKIALQEQLEQYLNDLLPSCFGVQTVLLSLSNMAISPCTAPTWLRLARSGTICT